MTFSSSLLATAQVDLLSSDVSFEPQSRRMLELMALSVDGNEVSINDNARAVSLSFGCVNFASPSYTRARGKMTGFSLYSTSHGLIYGWAPGS